MPFPPCLALPRVAWSNFLTAPQRVDWLEILFDNRLVPGGKPLAMLDAVRERYPGQMHDLLLLLLLLLLPHTEEALRGLVQSA